MRRKPAAYKLWCNVYLEKSGDRAVVAQCFNHSGLQAEIAGAARLFSATDEEVLGGETLTALDACRWEPSFNYRDAKLTDWPAYQASGETSVKRFEQRWRKLRVAGANEHNIMWELSVVLNRDHDLTLTATVAQRDDRTKLGQALAYVNHQAQLFERS